MGSMGRARMKKLKLKTDSFEIELEREAPKGGEQAPVVVHSQSLAAPMAPAALPALAVKTTAKPLSF